MSTFAKALVIGVILGVVIGGATVFLVKPKEIERVTETVLGPTVTEREIISGPTVTETVTKTVTAPITPTPTPTPPILMYEDLRNAITYDEWRSSEKKALSEILRSYSLFREEEVETRNELYDMLYEFDPREYGGHEEKQEEFADLLQQINPFIKNEEIFGEIFNYYEVDSEMQRLIMHLAHIIWIEENGNLSWSIREYNEKELRSLLNPKPSCRLSYGWIDGYYPSMILTNNSKTRLEAIKKIVDYARWHMSHIVGEEWEKVYGVLCPENPYAPSLGAVLIKKQGGCHTSTGLLVGLLRSVNIPAEELHTEDLGIEGTQGHGLLYLPSENLYVHGDWIYGGSTRQEKYSVEDLLWTEREIKGLLRGEVNSFAYTENRMEQEGIDKSQLGYADVTKIEDGWEYIMYWWEDSGKHLVIIQTTIDGEIREVIE